MALVLGGDRDERQRILRDHQFSHEVKEPIDLGLLNLQDPRSVARIVVAAFECVGGARRLGRRGLRCLRTTGSIVGSCPARRACGKVRL